MYLPFIKVVIPPEPCGPPTGLNMIRDGTCLPRGACMTKRGQPNGDCSLGFGECCRLFANCTTDIHRIDIDEYVTVLRSPEPATTQCAFKIRKVRGQQLFSIFAYLGFKCSIFCVRRKRTFAKFASILRYFPDFRPQTTTGFVIEIDYKLATLSQSRMDLRRVEI